MGHPIITLTKKHLKEDYSEFFDHNMMQQHGFTVKSRAIVKPT